MTRAVESKSSLATERPVSGRLEAIWIAPSGGAATTSQVAVRVEPGVGLAGDRYAKGRGHWSGQGDCEVTLIEGETLDDLAARGVRLADGAHRRNLVTRGVRLAALAGCRFTIGGAEFLYDRIRPPCRYLESLTRTPGLRDALGGVRAGICARIVRAGTITVGDTISVRPPGA